MEVDMPKYLITHDETNIDRILLETRWSEAAHATRGHWQMTLFGSDLGERYCEWDAPNKEAIEEMFRDLGIKWSEIVEVEVTKASEWRLWQLSSGTGRKHCWEITNCGREPESLDGERGFCPASVEVQPLPKRTSPLGRQLCWKAMGTRCGETVKGTLVESVIESATCPFFLDVEQRGGIGCEG